jgi:TonB family protein
MKKRALLLLGFFCFLLFASNAQTNSETTIYLSKNRDTCLKSEAYYTRVLKNEDNRISMIEYFQNGKIHLKGTFDIDSPDKRQGWYTSFHENGLLHWEGNFINNKENGLCKTYYESGGIRREEEYQDGRINGLLKTYFVSGAIKRKEVYKNGEFVEGKCFSTTGADTAFYPFQERPEFKGGEQKLYQFVAENVKYPRKARRDKAEGTVRVQFSVDIDGSIKDIKIKKRNNQYLDEEAMRVIAMMPNWNPGKVDGDIVKTYFALPIKFILN